MASAQVSETFERIEEYKAILDNVATVSARRQNVNNVYVGLNTVFLAALGVFVSNHLNTWGTAVAVALLTLAITPLNLTWRAALIRYQRSLSVRYDYLREIEQEFRQRRGSSTQSPEIGLCLRFKSLGLTRFSNTQLEAFLPIYFFCLYPLITLGVAVIAGLVQSHVISPISLP